MSRLGGGRRLAEGSKELPEGQERLLREPDELDPALVEQDGLLARARDRPAHRRLGHPAPQDQLPLGGRQLEEADGAEGEPPRVLQAGARLPRSLETSLGPRPPPAIPKDLLLQELSAREEPRPAPSRPPPRVHYADQCLSAPAGRGES